MGARPILFCSHVVEWGGAETVLADLLASLDRAQWTPHLACPGPGPLPDRARALGVAVHTVPFGTASPLRKVLGLPRAARALRRLAAELGAPLLYANTMIAGYAGVLAQHRGLRCLWHVHIVATAAITRAAARRAAAVVAPSAAGARAALGAAFARANVQVVPNGVAPAFFTAPPGALRARLGLPPDVPLVGIVGRIDPHKGHEVLLRAFAQLPGPATPTDGLAPHLAIVGGEAFAGSQPRIAGFTDTLRRLAVELGIADRTHFVGHLDQPAAAFADLDVVAVPSTALESAPRAVAEGQAVGRAVVASALGGVPELIDDGRTGVLVAPGDARSLATALRDLLRDAPRRMALGRAARSHAVANYDLGVFAARIAAVCRATVDRT